MSLYRRTHGADAADASGFAGSGSIAVIPPIEPASPESGSRARVRPSSDSIRPSRCGSRSRASKSKARGAPMRSWPRNATARASMKRCFAHGIGTAAPCSRWESRRGRGRCWIGCMARIAHRAVCGEAAHAACHASAPRADATQPGDFGAGLPIVQVVATIRPLRAECEPIRRFDSSFTNLWERLAPKFDLAVRRDAPYLNWRYVEPPHVRYSIVALRRQGDLHGYAVYRHRHEPLGRATMLVDFLVDPDDVRR